MATKVLVHEYLSGGGTLDGVDTAEAAELRAQGRAMHDAMAADLRALPDVELLSCPSPDDWAACVARADAVWAVAPETDGLLAAACASVPAERWLGCSAAAIEVAGSKRETRGQLRAVGLEVPGEADDSAGRCVVKPDDGAGAARTRVFDSYAEACAAAGDGMTLERYVDGEALSLSLRCTRTHVELLAINRQQIDIDAAGQLAFHGVELAVEPLDGERGARLRSLASRIHAAIPGLRGYVGVDLVWHPTRGPVVIEVNPRPTSAYVGLSAQLQRNLGQLFLSDWRDA